MEQCLDVALERAPSLITSALSGPTLELMRQELRQREIKAAESIGEEDPEAAEEPNALAAE